MGNAIVTKDRRWLWGLQYFCYGTLNSYEFSNATTVNNGESARNNGGRTRRDGREKHIFFLALLIFLRRRPPWNSEVLVTDRSIDFCISFSFVARKPRCRKKEIESLHHLLVNVLRKIASGFSWFYYYIILYILF